MKVCNSNIGKAQLRREQFNRSQSKCQFNGKKSLSKSIIKERVDGITQDNIEREYNRIACCVEGDRLLESIKYYLKFGADAYPSTFTENTVEYVCSVISKLKTEFFIGFITAEDYVEYLEDIESQLKNKIYNISQCK